MRAASHRSGCVRREKIEALVKLLGRSGAAGLSLDQAGLDDEDCVELAALLRKAMPRKSPTKQPPASSVAGRATLFCDGASRGNPGEAAFGFAIVLDGVEIAAEGRALGKMTNNQAEYRSLLAGLEAASKLGLAQLDIAMDSELVVRQVTGRYKVKNEGLKPLFAKVIRALGKFSRWDIRHIPRAENSRADALANEALDSL